MPSMAQAVSRHNANVARQDQPSWPGVVTVMVSPARWKDNDGLSITVPAVLLKRAMSGQ